MEPDLLVWFFTIIFVFQINDLHGQTTELFLTSTEGSYITAVERFGVDIECRTSTCLGPGQEVMWVRKMDLTEKYLTRGTVSLVGDEKLLVRHNVFLNHSRDCDKTCSAGTNSCASGQYCLENHCCYCSGEEFTLELRNVSLEDAGLYRCALTNTTKYLEFNLEVFESGLPVGFHKNLTFDYSDCCRTKGVSDKCMGVCKISQLGNVTYDPLACESDLFSFLDCVTSSGNVSHVHCCRLQLIPPFCWDLCSGGVTKLHTIQRVCFYWLQEIFQCYEQAYLPYPSPPRELMVNPLGHDKLEACWSEPEAPDGIIQYYTVHYKEIPSFPFFGGSVPFLPPQEQITEEMPAPGSVQQVPGPPGFLPEEALDFGPLLRAPREAIAVHGDWTFTARRKRQTMIFVATNGNSTERIVKEYFFKEVNTTERCMTIAHLNAETQYFIYVTATNEFGTSLPSDRALAVTDPENLFNGTLPDIEGCCIHNGVDAICVPKICDLSRTPSTFGGLEVAVTCREELINVAPCLADGRDHTQCCAKKGVTSTCLGLCNGTADAGNMQSIICLTMDMQPIYSCLKQGYGLLPSPPQNVTVSTIRAHGALIEWSAPAQLKENVQGYSVFYRQDSDVSAWIEVEHAISPIELIGLAPDTTYLVYVIARGLHGDSLRSVVVYFTTSRERVGQCEVGMPLLSPETGGILNCDGHAECPENYMCSQDNGFCCPKAPQVEPTLPPVEPNATYSCCVSRGVSQYCAANLCNYHVKTTDLLTHGQRCLQFVEPFIDCVADGRDHTPCCARAGVPPECQMFCKPPILELETKHLPCIGHVEDMMHCGEQDLGIVPGPPRNVRLQNRGDTWAQLVWDLPRQRVKVNQYQVDLYVTNNTGITLLRSENATNLTWRGDHLAVGESYMVTITSFNENGNSIPSNQIIFAVGESIRQTDSQPTAPHTLRTASVGEEVNVTWLWDGLSVNGGHITTFQFNVTWARSGYESDSGIFDHSSLFVQPISKLTTTQWMVLSNLTLNVQYIVWVAVVNEDVRPPVQGFDSEKITVVPTPTAQTPRVAVRFSPPEPIEGNNVTVFCDSQGQPPPKVTLRQTSDRINLIPPNDIVSNSELGTGAGATNYTYVNVSSRMHEKAFQCLAQFDDGRSFSAEATLHVQFRPLVTALDEQKSKRVPLHDTAVLTCHMRAYPRPVQRWYRRDTPAGDRHAIALDDYVSGHVTEGVARVSQVEAFREVTLTITRTQFVDAGTYVCEGCNEIGCSETDLNLVVEAIEIPDTADLLHQCCVDQHVIESCQSVCSNQADFSGFLKNPQCQGEVPKLIVCAKDGIDHRPCCARNEMPRHCLSYCNLVNNSNILPDAACATYLPIVVECLMERYNSVPGEPQNVTVRGIGENHVVVTWKAPARNAQLVQQYFVLYRPKNATVHTVNQTNNTSILLDVLPGLDYEFNVQAVNGQAPSNAVRVLYTPTTPTSNSTHTPSKAGLAILIVFMVLVVMAVVGVFVYIARRPPGWHTKIPPLFGRNKNLQAARHLSGSESVAFENPAYGDGQVHLPNGSDRTSDEGNQQFGWQSAHLESPAEHPPSPPLPEQKGMKYAQLT